MSAKPLDTELVRAFVGAAHADLPKVQQLLEQEPGLLHASMNWGGGDWETALGAASHVGRRDIAEWLLARGARMDLFAAAMLGELEFVQAVLSKYPHMVHATGPHQISLLQHALMGGEAAKEVASYIRSLLGEEEKEESGMIVVENKIEVRAGYADAVLERFKTPKTVHTFPGFVRMDVLHAINADGNEEVRVCTTWENEEAFEGWASSDAFRRAHARRKEEAASDKEGAEHNPIIGNKMTIYRVAASHFPAAKTSIM
jgi:heme-degrading monooxygenase HmoA